MRRLRRDRRQTGRQNTGERHKHTLTTFTDQVRKQMIDGIRMLYRFIPSFFLLHREELSILPCFFYYF